MNKIIGFFVVLFFIGLGAVAQNKNPKYDKAYADSLGADENGMKMYVLVILKTGTAKVSDKATLDSIFKGHMQNINRLAANGKLIVAGPLEKNEQAYRGIFIFNVKTLEEAKVLVDTDPAIKAKVLAADLFNWYGSAALPEYLKFQDKIEKVKF
ncbi:YciI family protein [Pedobacter immunditicola]|uniref:YciI family protein n=1 Tax=Pedobacter immunditicola TaxID=3133440 RepID=UPI0030B23D17